MHEREKSLEELRHHAVYKLVATVNKGSLDSGVATQL